MDVYTKATAPFPFGPIALISSQFLHHHPPSPQIMLFDSGTQSKQSKTATEETTPRKKARFNRPAWAARPTPPQVTEVDKTAEDPFNRKKETLAFVQQQRARAESEKERKGRDTDAKSNGAARKPGKRRRLNSQASSSSTEGESEDGETKVSVKT